MGRFVVARVFRIWPAYIVVFAGSVLAMHHAAVELETVPAKNPFIFYWTGLPSRGLLVCQASLLFPGVFNDVMPQAWTLSVELRLSMGSP